MKICPKCGSTNITIPPSSLDVKMTQPDYCRDCKYIGIFPDVDDIEEFRKNLKK